MSLLLFFVAGPPARGQAAPPPAPDPVTADVMVPALSPRAAELTARMRAAIEREPEWWAGVVAQTGGSKAPAWDARLGLSEAEYAEYLRIGNTHTLTKSGEAKITFHQVKPGVQRLEAPALPGLDGIVIDLEAKTVTTSFGVLENGSAIDLRDETSLTGPWTGTQWTLQRAATGTVSGIDARFALGKLTRDGRGILYFAARETAPDGQRLLRRADALLFYPLTPPASAAKPRP